MGGLNVVCNNAGVTGFAGQRSGFDEVIVINLVSTLIILLLWPV